MNDYDLNPRWDVIPAIPRRSRKLLDVGCAAGGFGRALRSIDNGREIWGVESRPDVAAIAAEHYDQVIVSEYPASDLIPERYFDCLVFNDVLEHMVDPILALTTAHRFLAGGGVVVASIPNIRFLPIVVDLVLRGKWEYRDAGVLDRTHLRFFSRRSMKDLFDVAGFHVDLIRGTNPLGHVRYPRLSRHVAKGLGEFAFSGFVLRGRQRDHA